MRRKNGRSWWSIASLVALLMLPVLASFWRATVELSLPLGDEVRQAAKPKPPPWIILLEVNNGYLDFFQNWWRHFLLLQATIPVVVIAQDDTVFQTLTSTLGKEHSSSLLIIERSLTLTTADTSVMYDSPSYHTLVSGRATHILQKLQQGQNIIYTDTDTVWVKDPFPYLILSNDQQPDMILQVDNQQYDGVSPYYCTGLMAIVANKHTIQLFDDWQAQLQKKPQLNQPIFNRLLHQPLRTLTHQPLPRIEFPGGNLYFTGRSDEGMRYPTAQRAQAVAVHNNYIQGHDAKKKRFQDAGLWKVD